jgi:DNA polymerase-3 subunit beta
MKIKFSLSTKESKKTFAPLLSVINKSSVLPILGSVYVCDGIGNKVSFTATDLENIVSIETGAIESATDSHFCTCIEAQTIKHFLNNSLEDEIFFDGVPTGINISSGGFKLNEETYNPDQYPKSPVLSNEKEITLSFAKLKQLATFALKFVSSDDLRPAMTGVNICDREGILFIVATDAHRMYFKEICPTPKNLFGISAVIPAKFFRIMNMMNSAEDIKLSFCDGHIKFSKNREFIISRLIDANYPKWWDVLARYDFKFFVIRKQLISFLKMAIAFCNKSTYQIVVRVGKSSISISGADFDQSFEYSLPLYNPSENFDEFSFAVNMKMLKEMVELDSKEHYVKIEHSKQMTKSIIIDDCMLLMPLMIHN